MSFTNGFEKVAAGIPFLKNVATKVKGLITPNSAISMKGNIGAGKVVAKGIKSEQHLLAQKALGGKTVDQMTQETVKKMTDPGLKDQIRRNIRDNKLTGTDKIRQMRDSAVASATPSAKAHASQQYSEAFKKARGEAVNKMNTKENWNKAKGTAKTEAAPKQSWIRRNPIKSAVGTYLGAKAIMGNGEAPPPPPQVVQY